MTGVLLGFGVVAVLTAVGFATAALLPGEALAVLPDPVRVQRGDLAR